MLRLRFNSWICARLTSRVHAICLGDSHIAIFDYIKKNKLLNNFLLDVIEVGGATAQGMINPNSKTDALRIFMTRLKNAKRFQSVILQLGEVDCGFVIWYYAEKYSVSIDKQLNKSLNNYMAFILQIKQLGFEDIIVMSAPLPTIADNQDWGNVANARREISASLKERTALTLRYNALLAENCKQNDIRMLDLTQFLLDENTGLLQHEFLNADKLDHHLNSEAYADIICRLLTEKA